MALNRCYVDTLFWTVSHVYSSSRFCDKCAIFQGRNHTSRWLLNSCQVRWFLSLYCWYYRFHTCWFRDLHQYIPLLSFAHRFCWTLMLVCFWLVWPHFVLWLFVWGGRLLWYRSVCFDYNYMVVYLLVYAHSGTLCSFLLQRFLWASAICGEAMFCNFFACKVWAAVTPFCFAAMFARREPHENSRWIPCSS